MANTLEGKVAIVTGSGRRKGLGEGILKAFAEKGAKLVVTDLGAPAEHMEAGDIGTTSEMEEIAEDLRSMGAEVLTIAADIRDDAQVQSLIDKTVEHFGKLDILVNNAGIGYIMKPMFELAADEWDAVLDVNLKGAFLCSKYAAMAMKDTGGRIINIASQAAKTGFPHMAPYTASKHGMVGLTRSNAVELGGFGITVNAVCPNHVTTGLGAKQNDYFSKLLGFDSVEDYLANMKRSNPMGRPGLASDTAAACVFLASEAANYITGEALNVSGGEEVH